MYHRSKDKILSRIGYYSDQKGILNRYLREVGNWSPHLEKSKKVILDGIAGKEHHKVVVLGSGWLLDVPLEELSGAFKEVWLADVYHPPQVIKKSSRYSNIRFIQVELTGLAEQIFDAAKVYRKTKYKVPVEDFRAQPVMDLSAFDYIVSCNILSQLDIILTDYLSEYQVYSGSEMEYLVQLIQREHLSSLPQNKSVLICDEEEWNLDAAENIENKRSLLHVPLPDGDSMQSWIWKFDTKMTYYPSCMTYFKVVSINI